MSPTPTMSPAHPASPPKSTCASTPRPKPHTLPHRNNRLHVKIRREKHYHTVWSDLGKLNQQRPIVSHHRRVIPNLKPRRYRHLVRPFGNNHWQNERRANVMAYDSWITVSNFNIFGYMSNGEIVPDVIMTDENLSNTGLIAIDASKHVKCKMGFGTVLPQSHTALVSTGTHCRTSTPTWQTWQYLSTH